MNPALERYYRFHSLIYDATRWSFLFGRQRIIDLASAGGPARRILEIGCGTGRNLVALRKAFPEAEIVGVDLSEAMLGVAGKKMSALPGAAELICRSYDASLPTVGPFDLILCSYALSMFNPGWEQALRQAAADLAPNGRIVLVDFHDSPLTAFWRWMAVNHVRMDGHLLPRLGAQFDAATLEVRRAYGGAWRYVLFVGRKRDREESGGNRME